MVEGTEKINANFKKILAEQPMVLARALYREAEGVIAEAKLETPVDTGALRASGYVAQPVVQAQSVSIQFGFGGPAAPYAVFVHERLDLHHPIGKSKYLEDPFNRRKSAMFERINKAVADALK